MIPRPSTLTARSVQLNPCSLRSVGFRFHSPPMAWLNGTAMSAKPMKRIGGWMTIQKFCRSGFNPWPSAGSWPIGSSGYIDQME